MKKVLFILFASIMMQSCSGGSNKNTTPYSEASESEAVAVEEEVVNEEIIYNVVKSSDLYSEPNDKSNKLINQKATKAFGEVHYLSIDKSCKVIILETNGDWSKVQITEPDWLRATHIGWVKTSTLKNPKDEENTLDQYEENKDYQILYSKNMGGTTNYYILFLQKKFDEDSLEKLANYIKREKSPKSDCNINIYDSKDIVHLIEKYPLRGKEYVDVADHFVFMQSFDGMTMYYPLIDVQYKEYGGKKKIR